MKNFALIRLPVVEEDLYEAGAWYQEQDPDARLDLELVAEANAVIGVLRTDALLHHIRFRDVRRAPLRRFGFYGVHYVVRGGTVVIIAVFHDRRDPEHLRERRREVDEEI